MTTEWTKQEIFDIVAKHLLTQKQRSTVRGHCRYRLVIDDRILKCGIGILIPDDRYDPVIDILDFGQEMSIRNKRVQLALDPRIPRNKNGELSDNMLDFLTSLQDVHDRNGVKEWRQALHRVAERYNLEMII